MKRTRKETWYLSAFVLLLARIFALFPSVSVAQIVEYVPGDMDPGMGEAIVGEYEVTWPFSVEAHGVFPGATFFGGQFRLASPAFGVAVTKFDLKPDVLGYPWTNLPFFTNIWYLRSGKSFDSSSVYLNYQHGANPRWQTYRPVSSPIFIEPPRDPSDPSTWSGFDGYFHYRAAETAGIISVQLFGQFPEPGYITPPPLPTGADIPGPMPPICNHCVGITHGMGDNSDSGWVGNFINIELSARPETCIVKHDWRDGANPSIRPSDLLDVARSGGIGIGGAITAGVGRAYRNAALEGHALARRWIDKVISGDCSPNEIELIGHSFGGVVNAVAAKDIYEYFKNHPGYGEEGAKVGSQVILDTPWLALHQIDPNSTARVFNLYGGLANGAFGWSPINGPNVTNVLIDFWSRGISPFDPESGAVIDIMNNGHQKLVDKVWPQIRDQVLHLQTGNYFERRIGGMSQFVIDSSSYPNIFVPFDGPGVYYDLEIEKLHEWSGVNAELVVKQERLAVRLEENSPAQISRNVTIPDHADFMRFSLLAEAATNGDELTVYFGQTPLYRSPLLGTGSEFAFLEPIFVGDLAGMSDRLIITLQSDGNPGAAVYLSGLQFFDLTASVPEPGASMLLIWGLLFGHISLARFRGAWIARVK